MPNPHALGHGRKAEMVHLTKEERAARWGARREASVARKAAMPHRAHPAPAASGAKATAMQARKLERANHRSSS
jgi:hypothetical protein